MTTAGLQYSGKQALYQNFFKFGKRWRIGGAFAVVHSRTYNEVDAFGFYICIPFGQPGRQDCQKR